MPTTIKVNGDSNGLIHKGTTHFVKCTAPDVCKTPSPGGPVPIPYPVIISMSSDLNNGTTTVKAQGNMAAIKGSEYTRCSGDEAGTAGGVVSNVNMKEAKFILFSFDVKMDGKNACRFGDKMTMNHANTFCMGGNEPDCCSPGDNPLKIDCDEYVPEKPSDKECDLKCLCNKAKEMNKLANEDKLRRVKSRGARTRGGAVLRTLRSLGDSGAKAFRRMLARQLRNGAKPESMRKHFTHKCAYDRWRKKEHETFSDPPFSPDHVHEIQLGGATRAASNLRLMPSKANEWIGPKLQGFKTSGPEKHTGVKLNCCK